MSNRMLTLGGMALAIVLLFAVNIIAAKVLGTSRLDLTEKKLYTLAEGTRSILGGLEEPVTLRLYLSQGPVTRLPGMAGYASRVKQLLTEYRRASGGRLQVHVIDPEPFSEEEDRAVGYGLQGVPLDDGTETLYFGIVGTSSTDQEEVIPFLSTRREQFLEYDITKLIHNLSKPERKVIGLMTALRMDNMDPRLGPQGPSQPPWMVVEQIRQLFDVRNLATDAAEIPEEVDVLMVVHPKKLPDATRYAIDQYVLGGGHAMIFVDPHSDAEQVNMMGGMMMAPDRSSGLPDLLRAWGLELEAGKVVGDLNLAATVRMERQGRLITFEYPVWVNPQPELFDAEDPVTGELGNVSFGTPGSLRAVEGAGTTVTPLIRTTPRAMRYDVAAVAEGADPQDLVREYVPEDTQFTLMARVTGKASSAFAQGPPSPPESEGDAAASAPKPAAPEGGHLAESVTDVNVIVVADTDMLMDRFWVQVQDFLGSRLAVPTAANGSMVINALDNLAGSGELISVRNRGSFVRPFERVEALRRDAELRFREKEQELIARLEETENNLVALEERKQSDEAAILSSEQREALVEFRQERLRIRKELRDVRAELRRNIESLEGWVKFVNIALVPILIGIVGLLAGLSQLRRHRPAGAAA